MKNHLTFRWVPISLIMSLVTLWGCNSKPKSIETVRVNRGHISDFIKATGRVEAIEEEIIRAKREARIEKVLVQEGERVTAGDKLVLFDLTESENAMKKATIKLDQAQIAIDEAKIKLESSERTYSDPSELESTLRAKQDNYQQALIARDSAEREFKVSQELYHFEAKSLLEVKEKEDGFKKAKIKLQQAKRELQEAKEFFATQEKSKINLAALKTEYENALKQKDLAEIERELAVCRLDRLRFSSPLNGTVIAKEVKEGMVISAGQPIMTIANIERLQVRAEVDELDAGKIKEGQETLITFDAFPDQKFFGRVTKTSPQAIIKGERTIVETVIRIDEPMGLLKIANQVDVKINIEKKRNVLSLPLSAVYRGSHPFVWLYQKGIAHKAKIKTGLSDMNSIEIIEGVKEGDQVIVSRHASLKDGDPVRMKQSQ